MSTDMLRCLPQVHASLPLVPGAYAISSSTRVGVYDGLYVALAERAVCELATADDRLARVLQPQFPLVRALASLP
jgi:predicted nucleic acid-binding protein